MNQVTHIRSARLRRAVTPQLGKHIAGELAHALEHGGLTDFGRFVAATQAGLRPDEARALLGEHGYLAPEPGAPTCERCSAACGEKRVRLHGRWWCSAACCELDLKARGAGRNGAP